MQLMIFATMARVSLEAGNRENRCLFLQKLPLTTAYLA